MATGWAHEGAVQEQIDASIADAIARARNTLSSGSSLSHCAGCGGEIPAGRRQAIGGVRRCVSCQLQLDKEVSVFSGYNRRGSKDSPLR